MAKVNDENIVSSGGIRDRNIVEEMRENYISYAMSVIVARALPDVRDGLKPVQRRILYVMDQSGLRYNAKHKKSAQTVGEVMSKYHPHGDAAIYDALVRLAQDFSMRYTLVDGQGNFGCFTKDTQVKLTDGRNLSFGELVEEDKAGKKNWTFAYNKKTQKIEVVEIKNPRITKEKATLLEVELDNGKKIRCTPNHRFMLRDGTYAEAQNLKPNQSLMPLYTQEYDGIQDKNLKGYLTVYQPQDKDWDFIHHLSDQWNLKNNIYTKSTGRVRHHIDIDKKNNNPSNIIRMDWKEHWQLHARIASWRHAHDSDYVKKIKEGRDRYLNSHKEELSARATKRNQKLWRNKNFRETMVNQIKEKWQDTSYKAQMSMRSSINLKKLWLSKDFKQLMSTLKSAELKNRWQDKEYREKMAIQMKTISQKIWKDEAHREYITKIAKERMNTPEWKEKQSNISSELWKNPDYRAKFSKEHFSQMAKKLWSYSETKEFHSKKAKEQWKDASFANKIRTSVTVSNLQRIKKNPKMMEELAQRAKLVLKKRWADPDYRKKVLSTRILKFTSSIIASGLPLTEETYTLSRKTTRNIPSLAKSLAYFENFEDFVQKSKTFNHKVIAVRMLDRTEDVYDLTIDSLHNFALSAGIFVHNSVDGDSPAAMRYTEARLSKIADELTKDIEKDTVAFGDTYDNSHKEPLVLPTVIPNLLINGAEGIAVGMATKIPPHNLDEIISALNFMIGTHIQSVDPATLNTTDLVQAGFTSEATTESLMKFVKGPDFPTGGVIYDKKEIQNVYSVGKGRVLTRAVAKIEEAKNGRFQIIVTEIPFQVNKARLISKIADLVRSGRIEGIGDLRDESARGEMRIVVEIKREGNPNTILNLLYKYTEMQSTFNANILALVDGEPRVLTLKTILELFITHRQQVVIRRTQYDLDRAKERAHILEGLLIALDHLDEVIKTIRESETQETAKTNLMEKFTLTEIQATAILDMQLRRLAALERQKIQDEYNELMRQIKEWEALLRNPIKILETINTELLQLKEHYPSPRRTKVVAGRPGEFSEEDLVKPENVIITLSAKGYVKRIPIDTYKTQSRGGKGVIGMSTKDTDVVAHVLNANTHDDILFFTNKGKVFQVKVHDIPEFSRTAKGQAIINIINIEQNERVTSILTKSKSGFLEDEDEIQEGEEEKENHGKNYEYLVMATRNGTIKKTKINEYEGIRKSGVIAIKLEKDDELVWVKPTTGNSQIFLTTDNAYSIRFKEEDIRETGRSSQGVRGIKTKRGGKIIGMDVIRKGEEYVLIVSEKGYGKMTSISEYPLQERGGQGVLTFRITNKTGGVVSMRVMDHPDKELLILSQLGQAIRLHVKEVSILGRQTSGVRLIKLAQDDKVAEVTFI